ncbi:MAG: Undecaprenyl-diphosphatase [Candidatus Methanofastidiosum methylothiophilum]|uniref:Undecaprenyl-diphosphatase n=1 Tax=Candidatus Methanofastidiosum methylothiophilum TaxID=1705564 RepID=A0A150IY30_9EURY|nr:MAG: Undecaprenyl-diphosphatase [Candidatus Methanofastidiosum methylthiophilus]
MKKIKTILIVNILSLVIFFLTLADILNEGKLYKIDLFVNIVIPQIRNSFVTTLSILIEIVFDLISMIVISILLSLFLLRRYCIKFALFFSMTILADALMIVILKDVISRARPVNGIISKTDFAFPSGHTADAVVFFGFLTYLILNKSESRTIKVIAMSISSFMVILIGFSRIYLNVHWLTDVIGGLGLGMYILTLSILLKENTGKLKCASKNKGNFI